MDLTSFLRDRLHEDFQAKEKGLLYPTPVDLLHWRDVHTEDLAPAVQARAVAEFVGRWNIHNAITKYLETHHDAAGPNAVPAPDVSLADHVLRELARPYREHPDFQPEWDAQRA